MKKILFVIPRMGAGGAEKTISWLSKKLSDSNFEVTVYSLQNIESFFSLGDKVTYIHGSIIVRSNNIACRRLERLLYFFKAYFEFRKELRNNSYDLVISFNYSADMLVGLVHFLGHKIKYICSERNDPNQINRLKLFFLKRVYREASVFVCQSKIAYEFYSGFLGNAIIIPNAVDTRNNGVLPQKQKKIISVGRLDIQKNYELLIESFLKVLEERNDYILEIYGDGLEKESLKRKITENGAEKYIYLKGNEKNIIEKMKEADFFVMTSDYEGTPNVLLEAMAAGLPVVTTDFSPGTARDYIKNGNGIIVPCNDSDLLKSAMLKLMGNDKIKTEMSINNISFVSKYDINNIFPIWVDNINKVLDT